MTWQNGRELKSLSKDGKTYNFTYDQSRLRTKKSITTTSGSTTTTTNVYLYSSKVIDLIVTEVAKDPTGIIDALIEKHKRISSTTT